MNNDATTTEVDELAFYYRFYHFLKDLAKILHFISDRSFLGVSHSKDLMLW